MHVLFFVLCTVLLSDSLLIPISPEYSVTFTLPDNNQPQTNPIGNIITKLNSPFQQGRYQIITKKCSYSKFNQYFRISDFGDLILSRALDRDDLDNVCGPLLCCEQSTCRITLDLIITLRRSRQKFNIRVLIDIVDENDNAPKFVDDSFSVLILENDRSGTRYRLPAAFDPDSPLFQIESYALSGRDGDSFSLSMDNKEPFLVAKKPFDYEDESQRRFELRLTATDHGGQSNSLNLLIKIVDINDNAPICMELNANISVAENTTYTKSIYDFQATDLDSAQNGRITYRISATAMPIIKEIFRLNNDTGSLFLTRKLDFELYSEQSFKITIQISDNGLPQLSDFCMLNIHVTDLNDNPPVIYIDQIQPVPENTPVKDSLAKFSVRDEDTTDNEVTCRAEQTSPGLKLVQEEKDSYLVYAAGIYDYELMNNLSMTLLCQDSGLIPQQTQQLLTIPIKDRNDNTPSFTELKYEISISEDYPLFKPFITVKATDKDGEEFGVVKYELGFVSRKWFSVHKESGEVSLLRYLDREVKDLLNITVIAVDGGDLKGYTSVILRVKDVNDNAPLISSGTNLSVIENSPRGTVLGYFVVSDADLGENGVTSWRAELLDNSSRLLHVDNCTVKTIGEIDRENDDFLYILVTMYDRGSPQMSSSVTITVSVIDRNDNIPEVTYPKPGTVMDESNGVSVPTNAPKQSHVLTIQSYDPDAGDNGVVLYDLLPSNGSRYFTLNHTSGQVLTNWAYDMISFTPTHPKEALYRIEFTIYNPVKASNEMSIPITSFFLIRVVPYRHFVNSEVFQTQHRRPTFNNVVLLILIGGFTVSLSVALISAIIWAKSKYSSESSHLEQARSNDGKFMMMMMSGEQPNTNNSYVYDPYSSLMMDHDRNIDNGYPINHSRSSTFNTRRTGREHALWNHYENKTVPRNIVQPDSSRYCSSDVFNNFNSLSTTDLVGSASTTGRPPKLTNSFYRHFEHDSRCHSPILQSINRTQTLENQYGSISPMRASICDPTPNIATTSNWVLREPSTENDTANSFTMC